MSLKLAMIDLDETFLRKDKTYDRDRFRKVLAQFHDQGTLLCIATGNSYHKICDYFDDDVLEGVYFACDNGNYIVKNNRTLKVLGISRERTNDLVAFFDEFDDYHVVYSTGKVSYFRQSEGRIFDLISLYNNAIEYVETFDDVPEDLLATKLAVMSERPLTENKSIMRVINNRYDDVVAVTSGDGWLDVYHINGGKGSAASYLMDKYNITPDQAIAFGDSLNDESMMEKVTYSVAMKNADPELALSCNYQIASNEDQAVLSVLEEYLENESLDFMEKYRR